MNQQLFSNPIKPNVKKLLILTPMMSMLITGAKRTPGEEENPEEIIDLSDIGLIIYFIQLNLQYYNLSLFTSNMFHPSKYSTLLMLTLSASYFTGGKLR